VDVDNAICGLATELKAQGVWDDTVVLTVSDFGRTLTSNGQGTDHAWGGNHIVAGGKVRGGQIFGKFPDTLKSDGERNLGGRGRLIPTTPWEGVWRGIAEWFGVEPGQMGTVLPNLPRFPESDTLSKDELFKP
jgi:cullin-associated NEDD8-dissociated protein 1